jgi:hypothetical protein
MASRPVSGTEQDRSRPRCSAWGILIYLAGDTEHETTALLDDLLEIVGAGGSPDLHVLVQHDGPDGAVRYVLPASETSRPVEQPLGRIDSAGTAALLDFLQWGLSLCDAERVALVIGSPLVISPADAERDPDRMSVFSVAYDVGSGHYLDVCDMAGVVREALRGTGRDQFDLLAIDSCRAQFLELAYELEDVVRVLIAPQTEIPAAGFDYLPILARWKELAALREQIGTRDVAEGLLEVIAACYQQGGCTCAVSALDLQRLDEVANAFDTLCIATLQSLGEGLVWTARTVLLESLEKSGGDVPVYDCASFFMIWAMTLRAIADESYQAWLVKTLKRASGTKLDRFCETVARHLEASLQESDGAPADPIDVAVRERLVLLISTLRAASCAVAGTAQSERAERAVMVRARINEGVARRIQLQAPGESVEDAARESRAAAARERVVRAAVARAFDLLSSERQFDLRRMDEASTAAERLADQAVLARDAVLGDDGGTGGLVIAHRSSSPVDTGWPRWSGVSMYRPRRLDDMMRAGYTRFAFHRRVHWAALLGAANLIEQHPRALWRLVSSLLASGSAVTRRDVLRRLTGPDSVVWGLRDQFQVMAPAPTLTLSLERRTRAESRQPGGDHREHYLLRLESVTRGAVVTEQKSRVQPDTLEQALKELNQLLQRDVMTAGSLRDLRSIGGLLGEDIFQALGGRLEAERMAARAESPDATPHLQLQIPRELMKYPWELLHYRGQWLGERYAMGRQVFMETGLSRRVPARRQGRVRPLVIGGPLLESDKWPQLPGARDEAEQVAGWFERNARRAGSIIDFDRARDAHIGCRVTRADVRAWLREGDGEDHYDIVHFAGHGLFRSSDPETSAWILSDGELWSLEIRNTLAEHAAPPWLVFANACEAGMDASAPRRGYHDNVFGLATAFINQGVAAYIAPLWPIDDLLAQYIALDFYRELLCERATLGEALRRAKAAARRAAYPDRDHDGAGAWVSLGWASLVLYGDPTEELFQALAGGSHQAGPAATASAGRPRASAEEPVRSPAGALSPQRPVKPVTSVPVIHAPDHIVTQWVRGPNWHEADGSLRGGDARADGDAMLELVEEAGLRRWRVGTGRTTTRGVGQGGDGLPGSQIAALLADDRVRRLLPARRGATRVIARWILSGLANGTRGLVAEYDREQVKSEDLLVIGGSPVQLVSAARAGARAGEPRNGRALLLLHGTFSQTLSPVNGLGPSFLAWAREHYQVVLGLDHWTLSKSPEENAQLLVESLRAFDPGLLTGRRLDIVTHSRGGLVARAFCELLDHSNAIRSMIFLGTPNRGTDLANPQNWGTYADLLVNMTGVEGAELLGRMAGLLAQLAVGAFVDDVPGLAAQNPESLARAGSFLHRLQHADFDHRKIRYGVVCADFEPATLVPNLRKIVHTATDAGLNLAVDALFNGANDLVVNTAHAWAFGREPGNATDLPEFLRRERVLVFRPPSNAVNGREDRTFTWPADVMTAEALGIHHCNLFGQRRVQEAIKAWLTET